MVRQSIRFALGLAFVFALAAAPARASNVISADFVYSDTGVGPIMGDTTLAPGPQSNTAGLIFTGQNVAWNAITTGMNNGDNNYVAPVSLHDGDGNPTSVQFTMGAADNSGGSWRGNYTTSTIPLLRSQAPTDSNPFPNAESAYLYNGVFTGDHYNWEITGLHANSSYNLAFFGDGSVPGGTTHTANGVSGTLDSEGDWNWSGLHSDGSGNIFGVFTDPNPTSGLVGFQIQPVSAPTPEPSTFVLAGLGLAGLGLTLRRKSRRA